MSPAEEYEALRAAVGTVALARDFVRVSGPEAESYLQGQLSQDVAAMAEGASALSLLLEPQGKVAAFLRVTRLAADDFLLDLDAGHGEAARARLARFKLRTKIDIAPLAGWTCTAVRGPGATEAVSSAPVPAEVVRSAFGWPGLEGVDLLGPAGAVPADLAGVPACSLAAYEARRIEAGLPVMGRELDESTIPEEAGVVALSVSFTKGCYTGQELVARIDSRGANVARRLRGVVAAEIPEPGAVLWSGEREVGRVTSAAASPRLGAVALAYVKRGFDPPADAEARWEEPAGQHRTTAVRVRELPLDGTGEEA